MSNMIPAEKIAEIVEKEKFINSLNDLHRNFVEIFAMTNSVKRTAELLNIPLKKAYKIYNKPKVQQAIAYQRDLISFRNNITQDYFIEKLREIIESKSTKATEKIQALTLLARITNHLKDKFVDHNNNVVVQFLNLEPDRQI